MADMSPKYQKAAQGYLAYLESDDVEKRRRAARMVGELGVAEAIERLVELAEDDSDAEVRRNARYSLGMFAAFRDAIESDDEDKQEKAARLLKQVMSRGRIGKKAKIAPKTLGRAMTALSVLLVVLLIANGAVFLTGDGGLPVDIAGLVGSGGNGSSGQPGGDPAPGAEGAANQSAEALIAAAESHITLLSGNVDKLQDLYESVDENGVPVMDLCLLPYTTTEPLTISDSDRSTYPNIAAVYADLSANRDQIISARQRIEQACFDEIPLETDEADAQLTTLNDFETNVSGWQATLEDALVVPTATPTPLPSDVPPTETPIPTEGPSPTPTETPDLRVHAANLSAVIDNAVNNFRSPGQLLTQYYEDAQVTGGDIDGCGLFIGVPPENVPQVADIPPDYTLPAVTAQFSPELVLATERVNTGLQILRDGWIDFAAACNSGPNAVLSASRDGLTVTSAAQAVFDSANETIQIVLEQAE